MSKTIRETTTAIPISTPIIAAIRGLQCVPDDISSRVFGGRPLLPCNGRAQVDATLARAYDSSKSSLHAESEFPSNCGRGAGTVMYGCAPAAGQVVTIDPPRKRRGDGTWFRSGGLARTSDWGCSEFSQRSPVQPVPGPVRGQVAICWCWQALGALLALLAYLATLGGAYPFEKGQRLGHGFLLGGAAGLLTLLLADARRADAAGLAIAAGSGALAAISAALLLDHGYPNPAVAGVPFGMGQRCSSRALGFRSGFQVPGSADEDECGGIPETRNSELGTPELDAVAGAAAYGFLVAVALAAATLLAISRYEDMPRQCGWPPGRNWWGMPVALGGAVILGQLAGNVLGRRPLLGALASGGLALAVAAVLLSLVHGRGRWLRPMVGASDGWAPAAARRRLDLGAAAGAACGGV